MMEIKLGKDLSQEEIKTINRLRRKEFRSKKDIDPQPDNPDWENQFLFLKEHDVIKAIGKLEDLTFFYKGNSFKAKLLSTLISTEKGQGYGTQVLDWLRDYALVRKLLVLGFCETTLLPFYQKTCFGILSPEDNHFVYVTSSGKTIPDIVPGEVVYIDGTESFIPLLLSSEDKNVKVLR